MLFALPVLKKQDLSLVQNGFLYYYHLHYTAYSRLFQLVSLSLGIEWCCPHSFKRFSFLLSHASLRIHTSCHSDYTNYTCKKLTLSRNDDRFHEEWAAIAVRRHRKELAPSPVSRYALHLSEPPGRALEGNACQWNLVPGETSMVLSSHMLEPTKLV